jgi:hypothetical protein
VPADRHDLVVTKICIFKKPTDGFMPKIVPAKVGKLLLFHDGSEGVTDRSRRLDIQNVSFSKDGNATRN